MVKNEGGREGVGERGREEENRRNRIDNIIFLR